jgi:hypothetical protein
VRLIPLFNDGREDVRLEEWHAYASVLLEVPGGFEALVLEEVLKREARRSLSTNGCDCQKAPV